MNKLLHRCKIICDDKYKIEHRANMRYNNLLSVSCRTVHLSPVILSIRETAFFTAPESTRLYMTVHVRMEGGGSIGRY